MEKNKVFIKLMAKNKTNLYSIIITYFILIMFGFIFFELSSNTALKNINNLDYALFTPISLFINVLDLIALLVIVLCSLVLMEVYKGFIEKNLKENSIFRTCGYSSIRLSILYCFVFIVICIFILPFAIFGGYILTYILHFFLFKYLQINSSIYVIDNYIFIGIFLLTIVLITWVTLFTIGYFYRKNLLQLLNEARSENKESLPLIQISAKVHIFFFIIGWIDLIFSLLFNQLPISGIFLICITLKKINLIISNIMQNFFSKKNHITIVAISECKYFLQKNSWFIYLYQISTIILSYILIYMCYLQSDQIICLIAYTVCTIFLSSCLIYKFSLEIYKSVYVYNYCRFLGYSNDQILKIMKKTFSYILNFIFFIPTIFQIILFSPQIFHGNSLTIPIIYILILITIIYNIVRVVIYRYTNKNYKNYIRSRYYE